MTECVSILFTMNVLLPEHDEDPEAPLPVVGGRYHTSKMYTLNNPCVIISSKKSNYLILIVISIFFRC